MSLSINKKPKNWNRAEENRVRKTASMIIALTTIMLACMSISLSIPSVEAAPVEDSDYTIGQVSHKIELMYNGYIFINDTIKITGQAPNGFLIGFPYKYGSHILRCVAYNATETFPVSLDVPLENHIGFYGLKISFPQGTPQIFTVGCLLSNALLTHYAVDPNRYTLDFPGYPSLTKATICNVSIVVPEGAEYVGGTVEAFTYTEENLPAFTYSPATVAFSLVDDQIQMFDVENLKRGIRIDGIGGIEGLDSYYIENKAPTEISSIEIILPPNASDPTAQDQFGRTMSKPTLIDVKTNRYRITFTLPIESHKFAGFTVRYYLPSDVYIMREGSSFFNIHFPLFQHLNYFIQQFSVTFVLPEGAKASFEDAATSGTHSITRGVFQEAVTITNQNIFPLDSFDIDVKYEYSLLWLSFRPALWMLALVTVCCAVLVVWKRPKAPALISVPKVKMRLRTEQIESFVDAYQARKKILLEIKSLETRVRKGKIPRRRYKVRRKTLETRLNTFSRSLEEVKGKMLAAGGRYAGLMRQLEVAETEINEIEANIESIKARHRRGELSLGAYRKLLADYERRKKNAEITIDGILIRLRE